MNYDKQIERIVTYFREQEKTHDELKIGAEFEYFLVHAKDLSAVTYQEQNGVRDLLTYLLTQGWRGMFEGDNLIGLEKEQTTITLEPGAQIELSTKHTSTLREIELIYRQFIDDLLSWLTDNNQLLIALGYQPKSSIAEIPFIPKERYAYMSEYLSTKGKYALNMMKGTAGLQLTVDYLNEQDYANKFRIACYLSPILAILTDNSPIFEGIPYKKHALRTNIWLHCDDDRCGIIPHAFDENFGYETYARYILDNPPILIMRKGELCYTEGIPFKDNFRPNDYTDQELEHVLTMFFPDVRTKKFIEIRMADSIAYPLNFAYLAMLKGLLYDCTNIRTIYETVIECFEFHKILKFQKEIIDKGLKAKTCEKDIMIVINRFLNLAKDGLRKEEQHYLEPLFTLCELRKNPVTIIDEKLKMGMSLKEALQPCIINSMLEK